MKVTVDIGSNDQGHTAMVLNREGEPANRAEEILAGVIMQAIRQAGLSLVELRPSHATVIREGDLTPGQFPKDAAEGIKLATDIRAQREQSN